MRPQVTEEEVLVGVGGLDTVRDTNVSYYYVVSYLNQADLSTVIQLDERDSHHLPSFPDCPEWIRNE